MFKILMIPTMIPSLDDARWQGKHDISSTLKQITDLHNSTRPVKWLGTTMLGKPQFRISLKYRFPFFTEDLVKMECTLDLNCFTYATNISSLFSNLEWATNAPKVL